MDALVLPRRPCLTEAGRRRTALRRASLQVSGPNDSSLLELLKLTRTMSIMISPRGRAWTERENEPDPVLPL
jgi:hypothetical protein